MQETESNGHQVLSDGRRVWVNGRSGESVARLSSFNKVVMIDVHMTLAEQHETGNECLDCRHDLTGPDAWNYFVSSVRKNYNVDIGTEHRPDWAK